VFFFFLVGDPRDHARCGAQGTLGRHGQWGEQWRMWWWGLLLRFRRVCGISPWVNNKSSPSSGLLWLVCASSVLVYLARSFSWSCLSAWRWFK